MTAKSMRVYSDEHAAASTRDIFLKAIYIESEKQKVKSTRRSKQESHVTN